ncbi:MAG TPA: hypothetical protein V6C65_21980, partial [Allocoleopsis sp.]
LLEQVLKAAAQLTPDPNELLAPLLEELAVIKQQLSAVPPAQQIEQLQLRTQQKQQEIDCLQTELQTANDQLHRIAQTAQLLAPIQTILTLAPQSALTQLSRVKLAEQMANYSE